MAIYTVVNPATQTVVYEFPVISDSILEDAISQGDREYRKWERIEGRARREALLRRVAELHRERSDDLASILVREMGKPISAALAEIESAARIYEYYADTGPELIADDLIDLRGAPGNAVVRRSPLGVILGIMPWNYPYYQAARFAAPNLVVGNSILMKPAPQCPESGLAIEQIFIDAGGSAGEYRTILASIEQIEHVIADPRVQGVSLTGSERAGSAVAALAGKHLKKTVLELGGSDPFVVLSTDDVDSVAAAAVRSRMENAGQACNGAKRFIVIDDLYDTFLERFTTHISRIELGDPEDPDTLVGPVSSAEAAARLHEQLDAAIEGGATVVVEGSRRGNFLGPTVLTNITDDNHAALGEFFGPVAQVYRVHSEAEAVRVANATPYGLGSYVFSTDPEQVERVVNQLEAGMVFVNGVGLEGIAVPFGGVKRSGYGRELGRLGADEFVNKKIVRVAG